MVQKALTDRIGYIINPKDKTRNFDIEDDTIQGDVFESSNRLKKV